MFFCAWKLRDWLSDFDGGEAEIDRSRYICARNGGTLSRTKTLTAIPAHCYYVRMHSKFRPFQNRIKRLNIQQKNLDCLRVLIWWRGESVLWVRVCGCVCRVMSRRPICSSSQWTWFLTQ